MGINCPSCNHISTELIACDSCQAIGCVKCVTKFNKQWLCSDCKSGRPVKEETPADRTEGDGLLSMFG